jgi:hypothetical protein
LTKLTSIIKVGGIILGFATLLYAGFYHMVIVQTWATLQDIKCGEDDTCLDDFDAGWEVIINFPFLLMAWVVLWLLILFALLPLRKKSKGEVGK